MKCKKCNVRIANYLDECPLCHEKIDYTTPENNPYNSQIENFSKRVNTIYFTKLIYKLLICSSIIVMFINLLVNKKISWSLYVLFSSIYISSFYSFIILKNKMRAFLINMLCLELLLFIISYLSHSTGWFLYLVGPIILFVTMFVYLNVYLTNKNNILRNFYYLMTYLASCLILLNGLIKLYNTGIFTITWAIYSTVVLSLFAITCLILSFNKKIENEIEKRFFI